MLCEVLCQAALICRGLVSQLMYTQNKLASVIYNVFVEFKRGFVAIQL